MDDRRLCVLNAGSSSLKFAVYGVTDGAPHRTQSGEVEQIGGEGRLLVTTADGKPLHDRMVTTKDHAAALAMLAALPDGPFEKRGLIGFGHRVVHGGPDLAAPVLVDAATLARIEALEPLAPLHNPPAVAVLKALARTVPRAAARGVLRHRVPSRPSRGGRSVRDPGRAVPRGRAALRVPRAVL